MGSHDGAEHGEELLSALELHIVELLHQLSSSIALLCRDEERYPLGEFDQRLLLEHTQIVERYVLAQAAARAYPYRFREIGAESPRLSPEMDDRTDPQPQEQEHAHASSPIDQHLARDAHLHGRAIIGEHPWEQGHDHKHGDDHPDEWSWEPLS